DATKWHVDSRERRWWKPCGHYLAEQAFARTGMPQQKQRQPACLRGGEVRCQADVEIAEDRQRFPPLLVGHLRPCRDNVTTIVRLYVDVPDEWEPNLAEIGELGGLPWHDRLIQSGQVCSMQEVDDVSTRTIARDDREKGFQSGQRLCLSG